MKKSLFFYAAATALMLTACSSEDDILQTGQTKKVAPQEVGFDVYTPAATNVTRAGLVGTMTTGRLQRAEGDGGGFGVYAFLTEDDDADAGTSDASPEAKAYTPTSGQKPNFMWNEKILWNSTNLGWYYTPLKYWPNETDNDSQTTPAAMTGDGTNHHLDRLTFFAYAPYVSDGSGSTGITAISDNNGQLSSTNVTDPTVEWKATTTVTDFNPNEGVDLLWGVAPAGGLSYTAVNGWTVSRDEGTPLLNMIKPDVNTSMKFLFQHALARFGINVVAAIDQVSPGGTLDPNTKITIESFKITGPFGTTGELNLNNGAKAKVANWTKIQTKAISASIDEASDLDENTITVTANGTNKAIAANLRWKKDGENPHTTPVQQTVVGVTTAKQDLLAPSNKWFVAKVGTSTPYSPAKIYYSNVTGAPATPPTPAVAHFTTTADHQYYTKSGDVYTTVGTTGATLNSPIYPNVASGYYTISVIDTYVDNGSSSPVAGAVYFTESSNVYTKATPTTTSSGTTFYRLNIQNVLAKDIAFAYTDATIYEAERNYLYVVPTNAALDTNFGGVSSSNEKGLRTITVQIEYYISTEDSKLNAGRAETKNIITKEVVLPSLANGKTYMLNLVLGLTSVKVEAEVDDWKVENVQADLPQNTAE